MDNTEIETICLKTGKLFPLLTALRPGGMVAGILKERRAISPDCAITVQLSFPRGEPTMEEITLSVGKFFPMLPTIRLSGTVVKMEIGGKALPPDCTITVQLEYPATQESSSIQTEEEEGETNPAMQRRSKRWNGSHWW